MAKEMMIIFVYDTQLLQKEEDDPASAILYFHPGWVSDQQRTALCGQIIGACHFLSTAFNSPRIFALQSGKFSIRMYGKFILAVGTDRNIADWVLEHRAETLTSLISFFHHDLEKMSELYQESANLSAKLYHMFETYLKILMYGGNMFFNIPTIQLPKSASHVFLEAIQLLQCCQQLSSVLGGTILYHNKVIATQLSSDLTKKLVLTDPYRIKSPAEALVVDFTLPLGVQLLQVYITHEDYCCLLEDAMKFKFIPQYLNKINTKKTSTKPIPTREPILSAMKRDQSLIFTTVPEEDTDQQSPVGAEDKISNSKSPDRPKFLNLKSKTTDSKPEPRTAPITPFPVQTSVCSTPMTELNRVVHPNIMSICVNLEGVDETVQDNLSNSSKNFENVATSILPESNSKSDNRPDNFSSSCLPYIPLSNVYDKKRSASMWEVREKLKSLNKRVTMRYYSLGLPILNDDLELDDYVDEVSKRVPRKTITDPLYPIIKSNGLLISNSLYQQYLQEAANLFNLEVSSDKNTTTEEWKSVEDFNRSQMSPHRTVDLKPKSPVKAISAVSKDARKSLTLPLKSLTSSTEVAENVFSPAGRSRLAGGVQLTPLMSKLSLLAMEEKSSGFCSRDTTPGDFRDARFTPSQPNRPFLRRKSSTTEEPVKSDTCSNSLHEVVLFICGQQDMVMGLLLEQSIHNSPDVVNNLWEKCTESLGKLERQLRHCLETYPGGNGQNETGESYSYLCMDPQWDTVQRGGPWGSIELGMLTHLHRDFINMNNLTEIILRNDDTVIYGHHLGKTEVYYQQVAPSSAGLPTPADSMGTVSLKAKRRLERDHAIILL